MGREALKDNKNIIDVKDPSLEVFENFELFVVFEIFENLEIFEIFYIFDPPPQKKLYFRHF